MIILETSRLILRHPTPDDLDSLYALYRDPEMVRFIPDAPRNYEETRKELEWHRHGHPKHPQLGLWSTIEKASNRYLGRCGLLPWSIDGQEEVEVAYSIAREHWGRGFATEAARAILTYGFEDLHVPRLVCLIDPQNIASIRVAEKIGMAFEKACEDEMGPFWLYARNKPPAGAAY
jgi:ribosomal-protein-alanine N-acetyltransferase